PPSFFSPPNRADQLGLLLLASSTASRQGTPAQGLARPRAPLPLLHAVLPHAGVELQQAVLLVLLLQLR
ncbi:unnamed protein product, partial [Urochloa humidicola]